MFEIGQIVFSKAGHDKGDIFIVLGTEGEHALLADGRRRLLGKPKRKKYIHIQPTNTVDTSVRDKLEQGQLLDSDIRRALKLDNAPTS